MICALAFMVGPLCLPWLVAHAWTLGVATWRAMQFERAADIYRAGERAVAMGQMYPGYQAFAKLRRLEVGWQWTAGVRGVVRRAAIGGCLAAGANALLVMLALLPFTIHAHGNEGLPLWQLILAAEPGVIAYAVAIGLLLGSGWTAGITYKAPLPPEAWGDKLFEPLERLCNRRARLRDADDDDESEGGASEAGKNTWTDAANRPPASVCLRIESRAQH